VAVEFQTYLSGLYWGQRPVPPEATGARPFGFFEFAPRDVYARVSSPARLWLTRETSKVNPDKGAALILPIFRNLGFLMPL
jgi:hypothetical protein